MGQLLPGTDPQIIVENVRTLMQVGASEQDAVAIATNFAKHGSPLEDDLSSPNSPTGILTRSRRTGSGVISWPLQKMTESQTNADVEYRRRRKELGLKDGEDVQLPSPKKRKK